MKVVRSSGLLEPGRRSDAGGRSGRSCRFGDARVDAVVFHQMVQRVFEPFHLSEQVAMGGMMVVRVKARSPAHDVILNVMEQLINLMQVGRDVINIMKMMVG